MTLEDKTTLLYVLTSPYSNIIGVYPIVLRIAAAEMGWTAEQLLAVLKRLQSTGIIRYDDASGFVWVMNWWDHNSAKMSVATTLREKTYSQIAAIPAEWRDAFLADFLIRIPVTDKNGAAMRSIVASDLASRGDSLPIPYRQATDTQAANTTDNDNSNCNNYIRDNEQLEYPTLDKSVQNQLTKIIGRLPVGIRQDVLDEIAAKMHAGTLRSPIRLAQHFVDNPDTFSISDGIAVRNARAQRLTVQGELENQAQRRDNELADIDTQLCSMSKEQFEKAYGRLPGNIRKQLRDRWLRLRGGSST